MNIIETVVLRVRPDEPEGVAIRRAAGLIAGGEPVAFPTETVYGLGANALDARAVARIFLAKGRPASNPLVVHVANMEAALELAAEWPDTAAALAGRFWPGPLSLVLPKKGCVPDIVTAGKPTVALRVPAHAVAQELLLASGVPIAAPSANRSEQISPTTAAHVLAGLGGRIPLILDGGPTSGGIESTVLALTPKGGIILRPGLVSREDIEAVIGRILSGPEDLRSYASPGLMARHYAPRAALMVSRSGAADVESAIAEGERVGWLTFGPCLRRAKAGEELDVIEMPTDPEGYSRELYARLHELDALGVTRIVVDEPPQAGAWLAVRDRLFRASIRLG